MPRPAADRQRLDHERVVRAAADLVNAEGAEALSINRLARELGVQPPSLYNHVSGLDELRRNLSLLNARNLAVLFADAAVGKAGADAIESIATAYRTYIRENGGLYFSGVRASGTLPVPDPVLQAAEAQAVGVVLAVLKPYGLSETDALHAVRGLRSLIHGFTSLEAAGGFGLPLDCDESFSRLVRLFISGLEEGRFGSAG